MSGLSLAIARAIAPDPVPKSSSVAFFGAIVNTISTRSSVSGRGTSTDSDISSSMPKNSFLPTMYANGVPASNIRTSSLSLFNWLLLSVIWGQAMISALDRPVTLETKRSSSRRSVLKFACFHLAIVIRSSFKSRSRRRIFLAHWFDAPVEVA